RDGEYIEQIGYYNPVAQPKVVVIDSEVAKKWLANGAQPTETVRDLFKANGIL
ncbi:MAG: 30S ribosomal protein S16, partial [Clostridia bacterium]|nr:30S ribosomal protein S16 [Clostridia bacterium]